MRKFEKAFNIGLIITIIGVFLSQNLAYSSDMSYLRVPVDIDKHRKEEGLKTVSLKKRLAKIQKRLKAPVKTGTGWMRIVATPQEAYEFHQAWSSQYSGYYLSKFGDNNYILPVSIWEKIVAWSDKTKDFEKKGYFICQRRGGIIEVLDFIPLGMVAHDPTITGTDKKDPLVTQAGSTVFELCGIAADVAEALNIDLTFREKLSFQTMSEGQNNLISIPVHSHHLKSAYPDSPSKQDQSNAEPVEAVYCIKSRKGYLYDKETFIEVNQAVKMTHSSVLRTLKMKSLFKDL